MGGRRRIRNALVEPSSHSQTLLADLRRSRSMLVDNFRLLETGSCERILSRRTSSYPKSRANRLWISPQERLATVQDVPTPSHICK